MSSIHVFYYLYVPTDMLMHTCLYVYKLLETMWQSIIFASEVEWLEIQTIRYKQDSSRFLPAILS